MRAFGSVGGTPIFMQQAKGAILTDVDGHSYIDYINSWGPMIMGHAFPAVTAAIQLSAERGTSFGTPTEVETDMAELIKEMAPHTQLVRMVNSGTESCMSALRLARGYTGRNKFIKFEGCYHGHADSFLVKAGSGLATLDIQSVPGVTEGTAQDTLTCSYNDLNAVEQLLKAYKSEVAAIILEPVAGNMGCIPPKPGFLKGLRSLCDDYGVVLIFDEVMTGFRLAPGGAQQRYGVEADLSCFGKVIGAGMPVGAFGGKKEIMEHIAPLGKVYQAGTLSGNPLAMAAGHALLSYLHGHPEVYSELEYKGEYLKQGLMTALQGHDIQINGVGSMLSLHFSKEPITCFADAQQADNQKFNKFFHLMLQQGVYLPPSAFETWFLTQALTYEQLDATILAASNAAKAL